MSEDVATHGGWSMGSAADELELPVTTLRSWCERYDLGPSTRTPGGHRRFTRAELDRLVLMKALVDEGTPASLAARAASASTTGTTAPSAERTPSGLPADLRTDVFVPTLIRSSSRLDGATTQRLYARAFSAAGVPRAWDDVIVPGLRAIGQEWADGALQIEHEHFASEVLAAELHAHARAHAGSAGRVREGSSRRRNGPVLLASLDEHGLPLLALQAALLERKVEVRSLGPRVPLPRVLRAARDVEPSALFLWASLSLPPDTHAQVNLPAEREVVLGGPGWQRPGPRRAESLVEATDRLERAYLRPGWPDEADAGKSEV